MEYNDLDEEIDGLIQRIQVRNFLCHDNLIIDFHNNNINWVYGRNGSGKSAIVTALVVGLGGKAAATRRGHNIQSFIKKGSNFAVIEIKIKNSTQKSYNHEIYGDHITVVRRITVSGVSSYMVKAASGEVISTKYAEISNIMLALEIQVDNPISVLNQDDARTFSSTDPKKLFSLFRRATNLDSSETNYKIVLENCNKAIAIKTEKEKTCSQLEREFKNWQNKHRQLLSRDEMKKQMQSLKNEIAWSEIAELEVKQQSLNEDIQLKTRKCQMISERLASMENDFTDNRSVIESLKQRLEENDRAKTTLEGEKKTIEQELRDAQTQHHSAQRATAKKREQLDKETRKIADFEHEITNIESGGEARRRDELERRAGAARDAERAAGAREATAEHRLQQADAQLERAQDLAAREDAERRDLLHSFENLRRSQQELKSQGGDPLVVWGQEVVQLRRRVQQAVERNQFSKPPLGPVGFYLRLKDQKWGNALEYIIGNMKTSFCVNSPADSRKLFEIIQEVYGNKQKPSVTCSRFLPTRHDVSGRRVRAQPCALDVLDIQDPVIANFLIDNLSLETVLLAADQDEAIRKSDTEANVPANCSKIVTEDCMEFYPAPNYRSYGRDPRRIGHHHYLHLSTEDGERRLREAVAGAEAALRAQEQRARAARADEQRAAREARDAGAALQALRAARLECEAARRDAERALDRHRSPQHDELEKELTVTRQVVESLRAELNETSTAENSLAQKIDESERKLAQIKTKLQNLTNVSRKLCEEIAQEQLKVDSGVAKRQNYERVFKEYQDSLVQMRDQHTQLEAVNTEKVKALATGTRVDNPRNRRALEELLQETRIKLRAADRLGLDVETVNTEMARAETEYRSLRDLLNSFGELIDETKSSIDTRLKFCYQLEMQITRRVNFCFGSILATRGYYGRLIVEHSAGELRPRVSGRDGSRRTSEASALSGGERSYCTVALLLALWECVELPFYFLDEFDVFMDPLNRKLIVELLLDFARRHPSRQFVFLAPDQPHIDALSGGLVPQLHRLEDPRP